MKTVQYKEDAKRLEQQDNRRRGNPIQGCDCVQCFGYCIVSTDRLDDRLKASEIERQYEVTGGR